MPGLGKTSTGRGRVRVSELAPLVRIRSRLSCPPPPLWHGQGAVITHIGGLELSHATILIMMRAEREELAEARAREEAAEARREEALARAQAYYHEHGEWEWQTRARELDVLARAEARADKQRRAEAAGRHQAHVAQLLAAGQQPRTIGQILEAARMFP
jgi:hypothetical protein